MHLVLMQNLRVLDNTFYEICTEVPLFLWFSDDDMKVQSGGAARLGPDSWHQAELGLHLLPATMDLQLCGS